MPNRVRWLRVHSPVVKILPGNSEWPLDVFVDTSERKFHNDLAPSCWVKRLLRTVVIHLHLPQTTSEPERDAFHRGKVQVMMSFILPDL